MGGGGYGLLEYEFEFMTLYVHLSLCRSVMEAVKDLLSSIKR